MLFYICRLSGEKDSLEAVGEAFFSSCFIYLFIFLTVFAEIKCPTTAEGRYVKQIHSVDSAKQARLKPTCNFKAEDTHAICMGRCNI